MKTLHRIALFCLVGVSGIGHAQTTQVHIAGADYPVMFVDTNLSPEVKQRIASDLKIVFSPASSFEEAKGRRVKEEESGVFKLASFGLVNLNDENRKGIFVIDKDNQRSIRLNEVASSNYVAAFKLVDTHSNAVQKARAFSALVKNTDWSTQPLQALKDLHHMTPDDREEYPEDAYRELIIKELQPCAFLEFSALDFSLRRCPEADNKEVLVTGLYMLYKQNPPDVEGMPILFYKGKWGFGKYW